MANLFDSGNAPTSEPSAFTLGDFVQWKRTDLGADYPNDEYTLTYISLDAQDGSSEFQVEGTASGSDYLFTISSDTSASFLAGHHHWVLEIVRDSDSERIAIDTGRWEVGKDLDVGGTDPRGHAETMINKIESILEGKADSDVSGYSVAGRSLTKMTFEELTVARDYYKAEYGRMVKADLARRGKPTGNTIKVRFS